MNRWKNLWCAWWSFNLAWTFLRGFLYACMWYRNSGNYGLRDVQRVPYNTVMQVRVFKPPHRDWNWRIQQLRLWIQALWSNMHFVMPSFNQEILITACFHVVKWIETYAKMINKDALLFCCVFFAFVEAAKSSSANCTDFTPPFQQEMF